TESQPTISRLVWKRRFFLWGLPLPLALIPGVVGVGMLMGYLLILQAFRSPLKLNSFEALRTTSRRALCLARLLANLPPVLSLGLAAAARVAIWPPDCYAEAPAAVLIAAALAPLLLASCLWFWMALQSAWSWWTLIFIAAGMLAGFSSAAWKAG